MTRERLVACTATVLLLWGCAEEPPEPEPRDAPTVLEEEERPAHEDPAAEDRGEPMRLGVPPALIHRARREASGLSRMPDGLREQALADRRAEPRADYAMLRADPDAHQEASVSFEGRVGLVREAGPRLWILALQTRRGQERWTDPLYVLSVVPPELPADGGVTARVDGWMVGERTIGRHALPLIVAYHVEAVGPGR